MSGFIKDYRKELDSNIWQMPPLYHRVWQWIKYNVNYLPGKVPFSDGVIVSVAPGERITSLRQIANGVGYYERGIWREPNVKTISNILKWLENEQMIVIIGNSRYTHLKVLNWGIYQGSGTGESNSQETVSKQSLDTNKKEKKEKKDKKDEYSEFVRLTKDEYEKLIKRLGPTTTSNYIERLNNYIGSSGKKYKSHYHTILQWVRRDEVEESQGPKRKVDFYIPGGD